jgi:hypothetical protein
MPASTASSGGSPACRSTKKSLRKRDHLLLRRAHARVEISMSDRRAQHVAAIIFVYLLDEAAQIETCAGINKAQQAR